MDPLSLALLAAGGAAKVGGGILSRNDALANAQRQAEARNASLAGNIAKLNGFGDINEGVFGANVAGYEQPQQTARLEAAQGSRGGVNANNITALDPNDVPISASASPAVRSEIAKRMLAVHDAATERAKATGKVGGYTDAWAQNELGNAQANRDIGVQNNYAEGRKGLIQPEADLSAAAATKTPSIWGPLLSGAGSIAASAGGAGLGGGGVFGGGNLGYGSIDGSGTSGPIFGK